MGLKSRRKGYLGEYQWRQLCKEYNLPTVWHNEDPRLPDMTVAGVTLEVKRGGHVPIKLYKWLEEKEAEALAVRADRKDWLVILRAGTFLQILEDFLRDRG